MNYVKASTVNEAVDLLNKAGENGLLLAGGTDLMVGMNAKPIPEESVIIYLGDIEELKGIVEEENALRIGALATAAEIAASPVVRKWAPALAQAAIESAGPQVRNRATIGGNIGTASPAGDLISALYALDATVCAVSAEGEVAKKIDEVMVGVKKNSLGGAVITRIIVPKTCPCCTASAFEKMGKRKAMTVSLANVSCLVKLNEAKDTIEDIRVVVGAAAPTVVRAAAVEEALKGKAPCAECVEKCAELVAQSISPITDQRATKWYRMEVIPVLVARTINKALAQLKQ